MQKRVTKLVILHKNTRSKQKTLEYYLQVIRGEDKMVFQH